MTNPIIRVQVDWNDDGVFADGATSVAPNLLGTGAFAPSWYGALDKSTHAAAFYPPIPLKTISGVPYGIQGLSTEKPDGTEFEQAWIGIRRLYKNKQIWSRQYDVALNDQLEGNMSSWADINWALVNPSATGINGLSEIPLSANLDGVVLCLGVYKEPARTTTVHLGYDNVATWKGFPVTYGNTYRFFWRWGTAGVRYGNEVHDGSPSINYPIRCYENAGGTLLWSGNLVIAEGYGWLEKDWKVPDSAPVMGFSDQATVTPPVGCTQVRFEIDLNHATERYQIFFGSFVFTSESSLTSGSTWRAVSTADNLPWKWEADQFDTVLEPDTEYTYSFYYRATKNSNVYPQGQVHLFPIGTYDDPTRTTYVDLADTPVGEWGRHTVTFTTGSGSSWGLAFFMEGYTSSGVEGHAEFCGFQLVAGSVALPYQVAWDNTLIYDNVTADVLSAGWQLGNNDFNKSLAFEGTAEIVLNNEDRKYSPENESGALYGYFRRNLAVKIDTSQTQWQQSYPVYNESAVSSIAATELNAALDLQQFGMLLRVMPDTWNNSQDEVWLRIVGNGTNDYIIVGKEFGATHRLFIETCIAGTVNKHELVYTPDNTSIIELGFVVRGTIAGGQQAHILAATYKGTIDYQFEWYATSTGFATFEVGEDLAGRVAQLALLTGDIDEDFVSAILGEREANGLTGFDSVDPSNTGYLDDFNRQYLEYQRIMFNSYGYTGDFIFITPEAFTELTTAPTAPFSTASDTEIASLTLVHADALITITEAAVWSPLWTGWTDEFQPKPTLEKTATISCSQGMTRLREGAFGAPVLRNATIDEAITQIIELSGGRYIPAENRQTLLGNTALVGVSAVLSDTTAFFDTKQAGLRTYDLIGDTWGESITPETALRELLEAEHARLVLNRDGAFDLFRYDHFAPKEGANIESFNLDTDVQRAEYAYGKNQINRVEVEVKPKKEASGVVWSSKTPIPCAQGQLVKVGLSFRFEEGTPRTVTGVSTTPSSLVVWRNADSVGTNESFAYSTSEVAESLAARVVPNGEGRWSLLLRSLFPGTVFVDAEISGDYIEGGEGITYTYDANLDKHNVVQRKVFSTSLLTAEEHAAQYADYVLWRQSEPGGEVVSFGLTFTTQDALEAALLRGVGSVIYLTQTQVGEAGYHVILEEKWRCSTITVDVDYTVAAIGVDRFATVGGTVAEDNIDRVLSGYPALEKFPIRGARVDTDRLLNDMPVEAYSLGKCGGVMFGNKESGSALGGKYTCSSGGLKYLHPVVMENAEDTQVYWPEVHKLVNLGASFTVLGGYGSYQPFHFTPLDALIRGRVLWKDIYKGSFSSGILHPSGAVTFYFTHPGGPPTYATGDDGDYGFQSSWHMLEATKLMVDPPYDRFGGLLSVQFPSSVAGTVLVAPAEWDVMQASGAIQVSASTGYYATFWLDDVGDSRDLDVIVYDQEGNVITTAAATAFVGGQVSIPFTTGAGDSSVFIEVAKPVSDPDPYVLRLYALTVTAAEPDTYAETQQNERVGVFI